ncbi:MAG: aminomethyl-transferring glycine dehydrogenase subunit GcvPA [Gammaproteobacteria bacterium]
MTFIPHTDDDIALMLDAIGAKSINDLFDEIPPNLLVKKLALSEGLSELAVTQLMRERAKQTPEQLCFIGAGAYEHHIPAAVWDIVGRGEFYTAYTPYQAEASQGSLQLIYEFQTMIASLTGMDVANASLYDGSTALAEAVLMAVRANRRVNTKRILIPSTVHPYYRQVVAAIVQQQAIELIDIPLNDKHGTLDFTALENALQDECAALVVQQPNFFGTLEQVDQLTDLAHRHNALVIAVVNPLSLALYKEPGNWGERGADIVCGEGQPLGVPLMSGGPYFGFMTAKQAFVRQMPGRIVARTTDRQGKEGFTLTLQAREQHIRRSKATSNICTNQGLLVVAATIYMSVMGFAGLQDVARKSYHNTHRLVDLLTQIDGVELMFEHDYFHEAVLRLPVSPEKVIKQLAQYQIQAGCAVQTMGYQQLENGLLVCATETKTESDLQSFKDQLAQAIAQIRTTATSSMHKTSVV